MSNKNCLLFLRPLNAFTAVYKHVDSCYEFGVIGSQKSSSTRNVCRFCETSKGNLRHELFDVLLRVRHANKRLEERGARQQGCQRVEANA